jgi:hypothetical protein
MSKRQRDGTVIVPVPTNKRRLERFAPVELKRARQYEYWHHRTLNREERAAIMAAMYIHLLQQQKT